MTLERDQKLFAMRPVTPAGERALRKICPDPDCPNIECIAVKAALALLDQAQATSGQGG